ncbi:RING-H2 finger protein ATL74 [Camellia lanceoleosa]|uniref:RING-H2 finger protein ATL74 n=1 Tax=Camellia lanceoleosa TaxID=1840588 RepID=A0ACC0GK83_9ERIC|nr:RING-H2 finger protein ATL74 [Camellia lanceoleosa]
MLCVPAPPVADRVTRGVASAASLNHCPSFESSSFFNESEAGLGVAPPVIAQGLDPLVVESFPVLTFPIDGEVGFDITDCHICLEDFLQGDNVRVLPACRHIYHIDCIQTWLTRDTQCPDCRYDYATWELESMPPDLP